MCDTFVGVLADLDYGDIDAICRGARVSGMRWTVTGAEAITTLRCQQASRPEDRIWYAPRNQTPAA